MCPPSCNMKYAPRKLSFTPGHPEFNLRLDNIQLRLDNIQAAIRNVYRTYLN